jgi:hypothetical protein
LWDLQSCSSWFAHVLACRGILSSTHRHRTWGADISSRCCLGWKILDMWYQAFCVHHIYNEFRKQIFSYIKEIRHHKWMNLGIILRKTHTQATQSCSFFASGFQNCIARWTVLWPVIIRINNPFRIIFHLHNKDRC